MRPRTPRMPTIVGILLVFSVIGIIAFFEWFEKRPTSASGSTVPINIQLTNISDTSFSVVWITGAPATGMVSITSPKHTPMTFFDDRDTNKKLVPYTTHMVTIRSLSPSTQYSFQLISNGKSFANNGSPYTISTASTISGGTTGLEPAYGTIHDMGGSPVSGAIILMTIEQGQLLSTITSPSGAWLLSLGFARTATLTKYLDGTNRLTETIRVLWGDQETTAITDTLNDGPVPTMILGKTYDFRKQQAINGRDVLLADTTQEKPAVLGNATTAETSTAKTIGLTLPAQNASLTTALPLVTGTGLSGKKVSVVLGITNPVSGTTTVGADGIWRFTPPTPLSPGKQSVTATTIDQRGRPVAFTHTFTILKSGTQVLGDATPSATLAPTITPEATASATPSATPTPQLEGEPVPTSGTTLPTLLILLLGAGLLTSGFVIKWKYA